MLDTLFSNEEILKETEEFEDILLLFPCNR